MKKINDERKKRLEKEKARNSRSGGSSFVEGKGWTKKVMRLVPLGPDEDIALAVGEHFIARKGYRCAEILHGEECPACNARRKLAAMKDKDARELANQLRASTRYWMKVVDRSAPGRVLIYQSPKAVYETIFNAFSDDEQDLSDAVKGADFRVTKSGTGMQTSYETRIREEGPLCKPEQLKEILAQKKALNLDEYLAIKNDELEEAVYAIAGDFLEAESSEEDEEDDDEDEKPAKKSKKSVEEDEEDDDDFGDDEEDEEEKPAKKSKKPTKAEEEEEEEEEEDVDEDEGWGDDDVEEVAGETDEEEEADEFEDFEEDEDEEDADDESAKAKSSIKDKIKSRKALPEKTRAPLPVKKATIKRRAPSK